MTDRADDERGAPATSAEEAAGGETGDAGDEAGDAGPGEGLGRRGGPRAHEVQRRAELDQAARLALVAGAPVPGDEDAAAAAAADADA